ncbi:MAG: capsule assembly Wzi family protein [Fimbriimonadales bacterium]|nr:capsule assembly Wzi family protein [Fimbriimonadales bacterium]
MRYWIAFLTLVLTGACLGQQLPSRDDPLYDYLSRMQPTPRALMRIPLSADEFLNALKSDARPETQIARWKLHAETALPPHTTVFIVAMEGFAYPDRSDWRAAEGAYRITGAWTIDEQALLEAVWSDARRRDGVNPSAFGAVPYARLTLQTGEWRWQVGYGTLRWRGGYSGGLLVNDAMPAVPFVHVQFPLRIPLLGEWRFEQFLSQFEQDGEPTWWSARRFERDLDARWTLALAEAFKALDLPGAAVSQVVPYYLYQKWYSDASRGSGWFNYLAEVGIVYKPDALNRLYLFWLMDDMRAPTALGGSSLTPRKVATLIGARLHPAPNTRLILEIVRSDGTRTGGVYDNSNHPRRYAYYYKDLPMGHPIGANRIGFYARAEYESGRWLYALDYANLRRFHEYRPGMRGYTLELLMGYQVTERSMLALRYRASRLRDDGAPDTRAGWYLQAIALF